MRTLLLLLCTLCALNAQMLIDPYRFEVAAVGGGGNTLLTSLSAHWTLNETSGTRYDSTDNNNDLTDYNTVGYTTGKIDDCGDFVAANTDYLQRAETSSLDTSTDTAWTISAWVKTSSTPTYQFIVTKSNSASTVRRQTYALLLGNGEPTARAGNNTSAGTAFWGSSIADGNWHFVVGWHDPTNDLVGIQVDNGTPVTAAWSGGTYNSAYAVSLGSCEAGLAGTMFDGQIDSVSFWKDRVLSAADRTALYNSGTGLDYSAFE